MDTLPDALGLFHARLRLRDDLDGLRVRYEGPMDDNAYVIAVSNGSASLVDIDYDPRRDQPFALNDHVTADPEVAVGWIGELLPPAPA